MFGRQRRTVAMVMPAGGKRKNEKQSSKETNSSINLARRVNGGLTARSLRMSQCESNIQTEFDAFQTYKYFDYLDITPDVLQAMTDFEKNEQNTTDGSSSFSIGGSRKKRKSLLSNNGEFAPGHGTWFSSFLCPGIWYHRSKTRVIFRIVVVACAIMSLLVTPLFILYGQKMPWPIYVLQVLAQLIFLVDMIATFFTSYRSCNGQVIFSQRLIILRYLGSRYFFIDLCASIPFVLLIEKEVLDRNFELNWKFGDHNPPTLGVFTMLTFLACKCIRELAYAKRIRFKNQLVANIGLAMIGVTCGLQICAMLFFICCQQESSTWYQKRRLETQEPDTGFGRYTVFLDGTLSFILNDGYPTTTLERWYKMAMNVLGLFATALLVGQVSNVIQQSNAKIQQWRQKMNDLDEAMEHMNLSEELRFRIRNYYSFAWAINGGKDNKWLKELSPGYLKKVKFETSERLIKAVPMFKQANVDFVRTILMKLEQVLYLPGDYVCYHDEVGQEMYFIVRGHVQALDRDETTVYAMLSDGAYFGEIALLRKGSKRTASIRAYTYAQIMILHKSDFADILRQFPQDGKLIIEEAQSRERKNAKIRELKEQKRKQSESEIKQTLNPQTQQFQFKMKSTGNFAQSEQDSLASKSMKQDNSGGVGATNDVLSTTKMTIPPSRIQSSLELSSFSKEIVSKSDSPTEDEFLQTSIHKPNAIGSQKYNSSNSVRDAGRVASTKFRAAVDVVRVAQNLTTYDQLDGGGTIDDSLEFPSPPNSPDQSTSSASSAKYDSSSKMRSSSQFKSIPE